MSNTKKMTPEQELQDLCDISVVDGLAYISELSPGTEYFEPEVADTMIKQLQQTPDLCKLCKSLRSLANNFFLFGPREMDWWSRRRGIPWRKPG